nr:DM7 family protein GE17491-like isoform X2 [Drosophila bipectinata]
MNKNKNSQGLPRLLRNFYTLPRDWHHVIFHAICCGGPPSQSRVPVPHQERRNRRNKTDNNGEDRTVVNRRPKYLPNLKGLQVPRALLDHSDRFVLIPLSLKLHQHDAGAAIEFQDEKCVGFDLPRSMFPAHAPLGKVTYLPRQLLPAGFDAGGVFGGGVLSRKFYPIGLMGTQQKGQTPPLFVGRRCVVAEPRRRQPGLTSVVGRVLPIRFNDLSGGTNTSDMNKRLERHDIAVAQIVHQPSNMPGMAEYLKSQSPPQFHMYVPDMSELVLVTTRSCRLAMVVLSTVLHPHVPMVAYATFGDEGEANCPRFELPPDVFPNCEGMMLPVFLPPKYLPCGYDAGCVFAPGALPNSVFEGPLELGSNQPQHNAALTPPLFVGRCMTGITLIPGNHQMLDQLHKLGNVSPEKGSATAAAAAAALGPALSSLTIGATTPSFGVDGDCYEVLDMEIEESEEENDYDIRGCSHCLRVPPTPPPPSQPCTLEFVERLAPKNWRNEVVTAPPVKTFDVDGDIDAIGKILNEMRTSGVDLVLKGELGQGFNYDRACEQFRDMIQRRDEIREQMSVSLNEHEEKMQRFKKRALRRVKKEACIIGDPNQASTICCSTCGQIHCEIP